MPESDTILTAERDHLAESRAALQRMREHTAGLTAIGGDHVSTEHLKQTLYRRMQALRDDPTVPLFFGRLDYDDQLGAEQDEAFFLAMVRPFEVDISAHTADEQMTILQHRWWSHDDLRHTDEWIWPSELVELWSLVGEPDRWPVDLGTQEESTVLDTN